jgi:hypothetical protein
MLIRTVSLCLSLMVPAIASAELYERAMNWTTGYGIDKDRRLVIASVENPGRGTANNGQQAAPDTGTRMFTARKMHKYSGIGAIGLATAAILAPKPENSDDNDEGAHHVLAQGATAMAALAVSSGLVFHIKDL